MTKNHLSETNFIQLTVNHGLAFETFLQEFDTCRDELHGYFCDRQLPIQKVCEQLDAWSEDKQLPAGWVGSTTRFWGNDRQIQAVINIRHHLTPSLEEVGGHIGYSVAPSARKKGIATAMLKEALQLCKNKGILKVLITCDAENIGSWKTIERCGGILSKEAWSEQAQKVQRWYWVDLA